MSESVVVTVLMPCRNPSRHFLRQALDSVLQQTVPNWELVVIDDHSSDPAVKQALDNIVNMSDARLRVVQSESHHVTGALNTGMRHAKTDYVCSLHCDDLLDRHAVQVLSRAFAENPDVDYFHSSRIHIDHSGKRISEIYEARTHFTLADFKQGGPVKHLHCWNVKSALAIGGMDETLGPHGADDYDFPWMMAEAGCTFRAIPDCLYYYREHIEHYRLTTHVPLHSQIAELRKIFSKHGMNELEIEEQIAIRSAGYLQQALFQEEKEVPDEFF